MDQDKIFEAFEGDNWFKRNISALQPHDDHVIHLLELYGFLSRDTKVLEVGAANGYRLAAIHDKFGCEVHAVEPSQEAVAAGKKRFPFITFYLSTAKDIEFAEIFDIVIIHSVFHWIDRKRLLLSAAKIDMALKDNGALVIGDFQTPFPFKRRYHHITDSEVYTYKQRYKDIFLSSGSYLELSNMTLNHDKKTFENITLGNMFVVSLLRKENLHEVVDEKA